MNYDQIVYNWLKNTVVGLNLCPFAKAPFERNLIAISTSDALTSDDIVKDFIVYLDALQKTNQYVTTILSFPESTYGFEEFFDIFSTCEELLTSFNLDKEFQIVCFHPQFRFEGFDPNEIANFVNRSPFPMIHILRAIDVENALKDTEKAKKLSEINEQTLKSLSKDEFKRHFPDKYYQF